MGDVLPLASWISGGRQAERKLWLQLLEGSFKLIYKDSEAAN
jgi:hypothetical protein